MLLTPLGIVTLARLLQAKKAFSPMLVTPLGMVMLARLVQSKKALSPMLVMPLGIVTLTSILQSSKALSVIAVKGLPLMSRLTYFSARIMAARILFSVNLLAFTATVIGLSGLLSGCLRRYFFNAEAL
jgi:hypothetical protein